VARSALLTMKIDSSDFSITRLLIDQQKVGKSRGKILTNTNYRKEGASLGSEGSTKNL